MSYRRKQAPPKPEQQTLFPPAEVSYSNPGAIRTLSTSQLTSGLPYQRKVKQQRVDVIVPCIIHTGMTYEEEADMYAKLDTDKAPLTPRQHTKALVEAGTDAKVTEVKRLVEEVGFTWALAEKSAERHLFPRYFCENPECSADQAAERGLCGGLPHLRLPKAPGE